MAASISNYELPKDKIKIGIDYKKKTLECNFPATREKLI